MGGRVGDDRVSSLTTSRSPQPHARPPPPPPTPPQHHPYMHTRMHARKRTTEARLHIVPAAPTVAGGVPVAGCGAAAAGGGGGGGRMRSGAPAGRGWGREDVDGRRGQGGGSEGGPPSTPTGVAAVAVGGREAAAGKDVDRWGRTLRRGGAWVPWGCQGRLDTMRCWCCGGWCGSGIGGTFCWMNTGTARQRVHGSRRVGPMHWEGGGGDCTTHLARRRKRQGAQSRACLCGAADGEGRGGGRNGKASEFGACKESGHACIP